MSRSSTFVVGMDLGDRKSDLVGLEGDEVRWRRTLPTVKEELEEFLGALPSSRVVIEVGSNSPWVSRLLESLGHEVIVANARKVGLIAKSKKKTDRIDPELLARLGRVDPYLLSPIQHRSEAAQVALVRVRTRAALVDSRTQLINHVRGQVKAFGGRLRSCSSESFHKLEESLPEELAPVLMCVMRTIQSLTAQIKKLDKEIEDLCAEHPVTEALRKIAGVGPVTALTYVLTLEDPTRFPTSREVGAYVGLAPGVRKSGDTERRLRITKEGDGYLRKLLVQCAHYIMTRGPDCDLREFGLRLFNRGGKYARQRAAVGVARKLAVLLHRLWISGEPYDPHYNRKRSGVPVREYVLEAA